MPFTVLEQRNGGQTSTIVLFCRMGRFLMNVMLAAGGYPWTVIPLEKRDDYMAALESGSVEQDIAPLAIFIGRLVSENLECKQAPLLCLFKTVNIKSVPL